VVVGAIVVGLLDVEEGLPAVTTVQVPPSLVMFWPFVAPAEVSPEKVYRGSPS
jgi:hypothetical protein